MVMLNHHHESDGGFHFLINKDFNKKDLLRLCRIYNLEVSYSIGGEG